MDNIIDKYSLYLVQSIELDKLEKQIEIKKDYINQLTNIYNSICKYGLTKQFSTFIPFLSKDYTISILISSFNSIYVLSLSSIL